MTNVVPLSNPGDVMESVILKGDLSKLTSEERVRYYNEVCRSIGLNPLTRPLDYIRLSGREVLYAKRDAADQLRKIYGISIEIVSKDQVGDLFMVEVRATDKAGRVDSDIGAVATKGLNGEALANAILKAITKAKRRVTLSISGLGFLDETEVESVQAVEHPPVASAALPPPSPPKPRIAPPVNPTTGDATPHRIDVPVLSDSEGQAINSDWIAWGQRYAAAINGATDAADLEAWVRHNAVAMGAVSKANPKAHARLANLIDQRRIALAEMPAPTEGTADATILDAGD